MFVNNTHQKMVNHKVLIAFATILLVLSSSNAYAAVGPNWIEQFGITWTFDKNLSTDGAGDTYQYGQFANGDYWIVGPVTIIGINPPSTQVGGRTKNGSMINPMPSHPAYGDHKTHGFDSILSYYDAGENVALDVNEEAPLVVSADSSLVSMISHETAPVPNWGQFSDAAVLTVLSTAPPANSFRPPWIGTDKTIKFNKNDLNYNLLRTLDPGIAGYVPDISDVAVLFERPWIDGFWATAYNVVFFPTNNMERYGREISRNIGIGALLLNCDYSNAQKETLMIRFVQLGIDYYTATQSNGDIGKFLWHPDGGHMGGRKWTILFAGIVLNDADMKSIGEKSGDYLYSYGYGPIWDTIALSWQSSGSPWPSDYIDFGEDGSTFYIKSDDVLPTPYVLVGLNSTTRYNIGTVKVTNGSAIVEGVGTLWVDDAGASKCQAGYKFGVVDDNRAYQPAGKTYTITSFDTNTQLTLSEPYDGTTDQTGNATYTTAYFAAYGHYSYGTGQECIEYVASDIGLPEFGMRHSYNYSSDSKEWLNGPYRSSGTGSCWQGQILAALIMDSKSLWNHNALFDYEDRYMALMLAEPTVGRHNFQRCTPTSFTGGTDYWLEDMWDTYRANYGPVWSPQPDTTPPVINNIQSTPSGSEVVTWDTDEAATSQVEYGLDTSYGNLTILDTNLVTAHSVTITELDPETTYHYRVRSADAAGNEAVSGDYTFTTPPDASNQSPTANAGSDQSVNDTDKNASETVTLDGSGSSDPDGSIVSYIWTENATEIATGQAPAVTLDVGTHTITLTVTDNEGATDTDTVVVTIKQPPTANAGSDQPNVIDTDKNNSQQVTLNGSVSSDADGTIQSYIWTEASNQIATGQTPTVTLGVGIHTITLTVTDNDGLTDTDTVVVTVRQPPTANAGSDQSNVIDADWNGVEPVTFDGSASTDADGAIQSYQWHEGALLLAAVANPTVTLSVGDHTITLTVTDNDGLTDTDTVDISINYPVQHSINAFIVGEGGTIDPSGIIQVYEGADLPFTITPSQGYAIADVLVDGVSQGAISSYTFNDVTEDHAISASFSAVVQTYTITASSGAGGSITPSGSIQVNSGGEQTFTITPDQKYQISDVLVDGISQGAIATYTFSNVSEDHTISASFAAIGFFTITATAGEGGSISPDGTVQVAQGENQSFIFTPDEGYSIADVVVDSVSQGEITEYTFENVTTDHAITVNFVRLTYTVTASAAEGGSITPSGEIQVQHGNHQTFTIATDPECNIFDVQVDGSSVGAVSSYTFHYVTEDHTIEVSFARPIHYNIKASATLGGRIELSGDVAVEDDTNQTFQMYPDPDYYIANVVVDGVSQGQIDSYTFNNVTQDHTISVSFGRTNLDFDDQIPPKITNCSPRAGSIQVPLNSLIMLHVTDTEAGVDPNSITIRVDDQLVYTDGASDYLSETGRCRRVGAKTDYAFTYQSFDLFDLNQEVIVQVEAADYAGNWLTSNNSYTFRTEMRSFGGNRTVDLDTRIPKDYPATTVDSQGNIYLAWQTGLESGRNVFVSKLAAGQTEFGTAVKVTNLTNDQCRPAIAIDHQDKIHLVWQDKRRGNWDIYYRSCTDGVNWATEVPLIESDQDQAQQTNPQIVIDSANQTYVVWEDDRNGNSDIFGVSSTNGFVLKNWFSVTNNGAEQTAPMPVADAAGGVYVVWTDRRNGSADIYGASNLNGPWANVALVTGIAEQSEPAIAAEQSGSILHLAWVNESNGNRDIYYSATSGGLSGAPLAGVNLVDDSSGAAQSAPAIATVGSTGVDLKVYVAWQDERNVSVETNDRDIYFTEGVGVFGTNVLVTDDCSGAGQIHPAMGVDTEREAYLVWVDFASGMAEIEYGGTTRISSEALAEKYIVASQGGYVGAHPDQINSVDDVCVEIPAGALWSDLNVTIHPIENPSALTSPNVQDIIARYEFGPSSAREFAKPVTITIPYAATQNTSETVYWYNLETGQLSQTGISSIELIVISDTLHAVRFQTTHFTQYVVAVEPSSEYDDGGGGGGGGCSMSSYPQGPREIVGFFLPYTVLLAFVWALKRRDRIRVNG